MVSLVPSLTETLCAVGGRERLVGVTAFCIHPVDILKDPRIEKVGGTKKFSREKLLALKPDLVLANLEENELDALEFLKSRVECYINGPQTVAEGIETLREVGSLCDASERGDQLAREAEAVLVAIRQRVSERVTAGGNPLRIFYPIWRDPWMSVAEDTFIADHLRELGGVAVPEYRGHTRYPVVTLAQAAASKPDVIWLPNEPFHFKEKDAAAIKSTRGFEHVRIELVDGDHVCWFGVRQTEGLAYAYRKLWAPA